MRSVAPPADDPPFCADPLKSDQVGALLFCFFSPSPPPAPPACLLAMRSHPAFPRATRSSSGSARPTLQTSRALVKKYHYFFFPRSEENDEEGVGGGVKRALGVKWRAALFFGPRCPPAARPFRLRLPAMGALACQAAAASSSSSSSSSLPAYPLAGSRRSSPGMLQPPVSTCRRFR